MDRLQHFNPLDYRFGVRALAIGTLTLALSGILSCKPNNPATARGHINRGSCLHAVRSCIQAIRDYAAIHGRLPSKESGLSEITNEGDSVLSSEIADFVEYGGDKNLTLKSDARTIIVRCKQTVIMEDGSHGVYCAFLSGEVALLPEPNAVLGTICPKGRGQLLFPAIE